MERIQVQRLSLDDVIFSGRNQTYGGYMLRRLYGTRLMKATIVGLTIGSLLLAEPLISEKIFGLMAKEKQPIVGIICLVPPPSIEHKPPPPVLPPPPPQKQVVKVIPPIVTVKDVPKELPPLPPDPPKNVDIGNHDSKGDPNATAFVKPVEDVTPPPIDDVPEKPKEDPNKIMSIATVEQKPEFPNGDAAMFKFLHDNIKYPAIARENNIQGTVYVSFVVNTDGNIVDVSVKRGVGGGCSEEAVRVINLMPKWSPGRQQSRAVRVAYTMPVKFVLQ